MASHEESTIKAIQSSLDYGREYVETKLLRTQYQRFSKVVFFLRFVIKFEKIINSDTLSVTGRKKHYNVCQFSDSAIY